MAGKTFSQKPADIARRWILIDASTNFRSCSTHQSQSQATLYAYALLGRFPFALR